MTIRFELPPSAVAFGGDLPLGCDALLALPRVLDEKCLAFSHGRAALQWLLRRLGDIDCVVLSAYTCPSVPEFFKTTGANLFFVDLYADNWEQVIRRASGRTLVVVPAFLGENPSEDLSLLAAAVDGRGLVLVDAAQTAFGHDTIHVPDSVAVLSAPRKCTGLADGAILRWDAVTEHDRDEVSTLPWARDAVAKKLAARALNAFRSERVEGDMLALNQDAENSLPQSPHRMSDASTWGLSWIDPVAHAHARRRNWAILSQTLCGSIEVVNIATGTPFNCSILVDDRLTLLSRLRALRVFATALWPNSTHSADEHPNAHDFTRRLIGLPIDQRYAEDDMLELAKRVKHCLVR